MRPYFLTALNPKLNFCTHFLKQIYTKETFVLKIYTIHERKNFILCLEKYSDELPYLRNSYSRSCSSNLTIRNTFNIEYSILNKVFDSAHHWKCQNIVSGG